MIIMTIFIKYSLLNCTLGIHSLVPMTVTEKIKICKGIQIDNKRTAQDTIKRFPSTTLRK